MCFLMTAISLETDTERPQTSPSHVTEDGVLKDNNAASRLENSQKSRPLTCHIPSSKVKVNPDQKQQSKPLQLILFCIQP